ncbi:MAG: 1-acyl-sn-glycerol-3-phosphate acyltransferase [Cytophagales bacterium]|nr:MAG: 1-acyl-sn-glycerol-3-phosphate acyltransferase [Cytophagales bacterium]
MKKIFSIYALIVFLVIFLILLPFFYLFIYFKSCRNIVHWIYRIWGLSVMFLCGLRYKIIRKSKLDSKQNYIFCANHTSFLDIPTMYCGVYQDFYFIGKSSLGKVPLFGPLYRIMHILVDRKSKDSKLETITRIRSALDEGKSIVIFPEGTIPKVSIKPEMIVFKDGAFKIAIEKGIPIVPVSIPNNYKILPDDDKFNCQILSCKVIFHEPILTKEMTQNDMLDLKQKVFEIIESELKIKK